MSQGEGERSTHAPPGRLERQRVVQGSRQIDQMDGRPGRRPDRKGSSPARDAGTHDAYAVLAAAVAAGRTVAMVGKDKPAGLPVGRSRLEELRQQLIRADRGCPVGRTRAPAPVPSFVDT